MSRVADFDRDSAGMNSLFSKVCDLCYNFFENISISDVTQTTDLFRLYDMVVTQRSVLSAMLCSAKCLGTHGAAIIDGQPGIVKEQIRTTRTVTRCEQSDLAPVSPMPEPELWFETLLAKSQ